MNTDYFKKKLNIFKVFFHGINLIEASAGTGKTFTIVLLYLRLLLGIGDKKQNIKKLSVQEILVVTFTNTAKEELYIRIKQAIQKLYLTCINKKSQDPIFTLLLNEINDIDEAIYILYIAQNNIDQCSIYTIHSFCQNILQLHTFHHNIVFRTEIIENEDDLYLQATQDFWRRYFYNLPEDITKIIFQDYNSPEHLLKKIKPFFHINLIHLNKKFLKNQTLISYHQNNIKKINNFKEKWLMYYHSILNKIDVLKVNRRIYSKSNLSRWIKEITIWAKSETKNYMIPLVLRYFTKNKINSEYIIFNEIQKILNYHFSLKKIIIFNAIKNINQFILREKKNQSLIGFNDLLNILLKNIKKERHLRKLIRKKYPVAFVDEFQDTNIEQYKIFNLLYKENKKTALFLIGDPKQAIYSFRGADIFSYLHAKSKIKKYFYLDINWRSSVNMCNSINFLFSQHKNPFIFKKIVFQPLESACKNSDMNFKINDVPQIPISLFLQEKKEVNIDDYQIWISKQCANEISYWLDCAKSGKAKIKTKKGEKILTANDIAILVRNQKEAFLIQQELQKLNITSVYSSNKNSIFQIFDAQELLWILESILEPDNEKLLKQSISTHILKKISSTMEKKIKNSYLIIEKLYEYHILWEEVGIFYMIKTMILEYQMNSNIIENNLYYEKNLNFLHIAELLQEQFEFFNKKKTLIYWFQKKILQKTQHSYNECIRSLNESESIKIITIHKSKGLEYPIVWIPFSIDFKQSKSPIYHNEKNFKIFFDIEQRNEGLKIADKERLAEDVRFLYVALTRSIVHCSIGIACLVKKPTKYKEHSDIHKSGLGYIIQNGKTMNYVSLFTQLNKLSSNNFIEVKNNVKNSTLPMNHKNIYLVPKPIILKENIKNIWNITSFTKLKKESKQITNEIKSIILENNLTVDKIKKSQKLTIHNFPVGKNTGLMMHYILKRLHYLEKKEYDWFAAILEEYNIALKWTPILISWIKDIINHSLTNQNIFLSRINKRMCLKEFEFFLPIKNTLYSTELNTITQSFDPISMISPKLCFNPVTGILKGFIDLVFYWDKKYYIIDYKSTWLGNNNNFYSNKNIQKEIIKQRYDLQYQLYTIAIHKYLQKKVKNYNYQKHFGGVFYIFLRACDHQKKNNGIFYTIPHFQLIEKMTVLMS